MPKKNPFEWDRQVGSVLRTLFICATICFCVYQISESLAKILDKPPWLEFAGLVIGLLVGPSGLLYVVIRRIRAYTKTNARRLKRLEEKMDPNRTSSGLAHDGSSPPEDKA